MEPTFTFRNIDATDGLRDHALEKMKKLDKYLHKPISAHVIFQLERFEHVVEISLQADGHRYIGIGRSTDMYPSIDEAIEKILTQVRKDHDRRRGHHKSE